MARMTAAPVLTTLMGLALLFGCSRTSRPPDPAAGRIPTGFLFESLSQGGRTYAYAVYVPRAYDPSSSWPLVLFLHGAGESGTDGAKMLIQGIGSAMQWNIDAWPAIVIFPQKPTEDAEWEQHDAALMEMLARARARYRIDPGRLYLTGLSQGGHGSWVLGARHADLWAAIVPVCGYAASRRSAKRDLPPPYDGGAAELAALLRATPVWAFHGEADDVVPVKETKDLVAALEHAGGRPRVTVLPGVGHAAWDRAYGDPELPRWLFAQRRGAR
jgi:predicted peptidase